MSAVTDGLSDLSLGEEDEIAIAVDDASDEQTITFDLCFGGSFLTNSIINFQSMRATLANDDSIKAPIYGRTAPVSHWLREEDGGKSLNWWDQIRVKSGTAYQPISNPNNSAQLIPSPAVGIIVSRGKIMEHLGRSGKVFHGPSASLGLGFGQPSGSRGRAFLIYSP
ncbi:hypothetical protein V6N13_133189 [Hibiscus sabdariffa]